jgi:Fe-S oxidoreductase
VPRLVNLATGTPLLAGLAKRMAGVAPQRSIPRFAPRTFRDWWREHRADGRGGGEGAEVILWPDTFNNHFHPETAIAAVEVLEDAGCTVRIPEATLCCGRPLYEYGMLDLARRQLRQILDALRPQIRAGVPVVGLEPSCVSVFRDELPNLFPHDHDARRLREQTFTLAEFLERSGYEPPRLRRRVLLHGHCHHKAVLDLTPEERILDRMGVERETLDSGCCGMAGAFGYEAEKYGVSVGAGERVLLPAVRAASPDTVVVADGFSCRGQVNDLTERKAVHLSEVIRSALRYSDAEPETAVVAAGGGLPLRRAATLAAAATMAGVAAYGFVRTARAIERSRR